MLDALGNFLALVIGFLFWVCVLGAIGVALFSKAMKIMNDHRPPADWSQVPYELRNGASLSQLDLQETRYAGGGYNRSMSVTYDTSTVLPPEYRALPSRGPINNQLPAGQHSDIWASPPPALPPPPVHRQQGYPYNRQQYPYYG
jgi:hypothetical protein